MGQLRSESSASETEGLERDPKRHKILGLKSGKVPGAQLPADTSNDFSPTGSTCSFCQSSKTSEVIFACTNPTHCFFNSLFLENCYAHAAYAYGQMAETISWSLW